MRTEKQIQEQLNRIIKEIVVEYDLLVIKNKVYTKEEFEKEKLMKWEHFGEWAYDNLK